MSLFQERAQCYGLETNLRHAVNGDRGVRIWGGWGGIPVKSGQSVNAGKGALIRVSR